MGDHHDRGPVLVQTGEDVHDLRTIVGVEVSRRLIGQDQFRIADNGTRDSRPLLLTSGQLVRVVSRTMSDADPVHRIGDARPPVAAPILPVGEAEFDVLRDRQLVDQVEALEYEAERLSTKTGKGRLVQDGQVTIPEEVSSRRRAVDRPERVQQRGFAATGRAHDGDELAGGDHEVDVVKSGGLDVVGDVAPLYAFQTDQVMALSIGC